MLVMCEEFDVCVVEVEVCFEGKDVLCLDGWSGLCVVFDCIEFWYGV